MPATTTTQIPSAIQEFYDRVLLRRAVPLLVHERFGQKRPMPKGHGSQIKFRRYNALNPATTPLTEGVKPTGSQLSRTDVTASLNQYGDYVELTDRVILENIDPIITEAVEILGEQMALSLDTVIRDVIVGGTNVMYTNGSARNAVNTTIADNPAVLDKAIRSLKNQNARPFTRMVKASDKVSTFPIRPAFIGIVHPDITYDLEKVNGFVPVEKYANYGDIMEGEVGAYRGIRFVETTNAKIWPDAGGDATATGNPNVKSTSGTNADVYALLIVAQDAYGVTELREGGAKTIIKELGSGGTADPLNQLATVGWKAMLTARILNDAWMVRIETAVSK